MNWILIVIIILILILYIKAKMKISMYESQIIYITNKIENIIDKNEKSYLFIVTNNKYIKDLSNSLNELIEKIYIERQELSILKNSMSMVLTDISHDIKTPITTIKGYVEILQNKNNDSETNRILKKLSKKIQETIRTISQFFNLAKIESGDIKINIENVNINQVTKEIVMEYYDYLEERKYSVDINIPDKPIFIDIDKEAIKRIINNLIENSLKYGNEGNFLGISIKEETRFIDINIEDHGKGISKEDSKYIFERSYILRSENKNRYYGSGLGLSISKKLAQKMNSDIFLYSEPSVKTIFKIRINKVIKKL